MDYYALEDTAKLSDTLHHSLLAWEPCSSDE